QQLLALRLGLAFNLKLLGLHGSVCLGRFCFFHFMHSGSRSTCSHATPATECSHIHGFSSEQDKAGEESPLPPPVIPLLPALAQQAEDCLRQLVGLSQHRGTSLLHDLVLGQIGRFSG